MKNKQDEETRPFKPKASYGHNGKLLQTSSMNSSATLTNSCSTARAFIVNNSSMLMPQQQQQQQQQQQKQQDEQHQHRFFFNALSETNTHHKLNNSAQSNNRHSSYMNSSTTSTEKESVKSRNISMNNESLLLSLNSLMPKSNPNQQGIFMREHFDFVICVL